MARFIDCPNNGKCGFGRRVLGSDSYNKCMKAASGRFAQSAGNMVNAVNATPPSAAAPRPRSRIELQEALDQIEVSDKYTLPCHYVGDMVFDEEESFTMTFIAENHQESRLFTRKCEPSTWFGSKKDASNYDEVGSDDWFSSLAITHRKDLNIEYDSDPYSAEERERGRQAILSALKDAIGDDVNGMSDDYVFPDIQVVWSGKLDDAIPYACDGQDVIVKTPSFFFTRNGERLTDPVRLVGNHKIRMPGEEDRKRGERLTGIKDDMTSEYFDHSDITQYASSVSRKPTW